MEQGILKLTEQEIGEVEAHSVKIGLTVEGENFLYGNAAFEKCAEVKKAVDRLKAVEPEVGIYVKSVQVKSESGWFSKSSKGVYQLEVVLKNLIKLNEILGIVMDMDNVKMNCLEWVFNDDDAKIELIKKAMAKAKKKAEAMVSVVGYKIIGIRACSDSYDIPNTNVTIRAPSKDCRDIKKRAMQSQILDASFADIDIGTEMKGKKEITAIVSLEFVIDKESV